MPLKSAIPSKSDPQLKRWYAKYNRLYFDGQLPDAAVWWEPLASTYADCNLVEGEWRIRINPSLSGWTAIWKLTLLHEMAHVNLWPNKRHGKKFHEEMMRLAGLGAFTGLW